MSLPGISGPGSSLLFKHRDVFGVTRSPGPGLTPLLVTGSLGRLGHRQAGSCLPGLRPPHVMGSQRAFLLRGLWLGGGGGHRHPDCPARTPLASPCKGSARSRVAHGTCVAGLPPLHPSLSEDLSAPLLGCPRPDAAGEPSGAPGPMRKTKEKFQNGARRVSRAGEGRRCVLLPPGG